MSVIAIESTDCSGVPRLSDVNLTVVDEVEAEALDTQEYFCPQGHDFILEFMPGAVIPSFWECPKCETIAANRPF